MTNLKEELGAKKLQGFVTQQGDKQQIEIILRQDQEMMMEQSAGEITLQEIFMILIKKLWLIILCAVVGGGAAYYYTDQYITPVYDAYITMYVNNNSERIQSEVSSGDINLSKQLVPTYMQILKSNTVLDEVVKRTDLGYSRNAIKGMISTSSIAETEIFRVQVSCLDPEHAALIANAIGEIAPDEIIRITRAGSVEVIDQAEVAPGPSSPNVMLNTIIGVMLGGVVSVLLVLVLAMLDTRIKESKQLEQAFGLPSLGEIPKFGKLTRKERRAKRKARERMLKQNKKEAKKNKKTRYKANEISLEQESKEHIEKAQEASSQVAQESSEIEEQVAAQ